MTADAGKASLNERDPQGLQVPGLVRIAEGVDRKIMTVVESSMAEITAGLDIDIEDLKSKNGTFVNGKQLKPGIIIEIKQGVPSVIGMSVLCLGKGCLEEV